MIVLPGSILRLCLLCFSEAAICHWKYITDIFPYRYTAGHRVRAAVPCMAALGMLKLAVYNPPLPRPAQASPSCCAVIASMTCHASPPRRGLGARCPLVGTGAPAGPGRLRLLTGLA